jgi:hypothetical protein
MKEWGKLWRGLVDVAVEWMRRRRGLESSACVEAWRPRSVPCLECLVAGVR